MYIRKFLLGLAMILFSITLIFSTAFSQELKGGPYTRKEPLHDNWLELFWAYDAAEGWVDNVFVTSNSAVLLAESFDGNALDASVWKAQLPEEMFAVEDGALYVDKTDKNVIGIYAKKAFQPPFTVELDIKYGSGHPRADIVDEASRDGKGGVTDWWASEISAGQDEDGSVGVFSNGWVVLGNLPTDDYNHYKISIVDDATANVTITQGKGASVTAVKPAEKLTTTWADVKTLY